MSDEIGGVDPPEYEALFDLPSEFEDPENLGLTSDTLDSQVPRAPKLDEPAETPVFEVDVLSEMQAIADADASGQVLRFNPTPGYFRDLREDEVKGLSHDNRVRYSTTADVYRSLVQEESGRRPVGTSGLDVVASRATGDAAARIRVDASPEQKAKYHYYWAGSHEWRDLQKMGYQVVRGDEVQTNCLTPSDTHQILRNGVLEHLLLKRPKEQHSAHIEAVARKSQERITGVKEEAKDRMSSSGAVTPFEGDNLPGRGAQGVAWQTATEQPGTPQG